MTPDEYKAQHPDEYIYWHQVTAEQPEEFVSVLGHMIDMEPEFPQVRECYRVGNRYMFPALNAFARIDRRADMPG